MQDLPNILIKKGYVFKDIIRGGGQSHTYILRKDDKLFLMKTPLTNQLSTEQKFRFKQEAKALEILNGKGTPKVIEYNFESEVPYIVMEYVQGKTLSSFVNGRMLNIDLSLEILEKLINIITHVHELGMQHRDIKPDNIIIQEDGEVYLIDFGLCRIEKDIPDFKTPNGKELGNRFLRLPELGKGEKITSSVSDVTFITGIFFYLLTSKNPNQLLDENNNPPHRKSNVKSIFDNQSWLNQIFDKGFAYSIAQRFQTATDLKLFINTIKNKVLESPDELIINEFDTLLSSYAYTKLNDILSHLISMHDVFNQGLEFAIGKNVRTNGVSPQVDETGYAVRTEMFIYPTSRQNPRLWWKNISIINTELTHITHQCLINNQIISTDVFAIVESERIKENYYDRGIYTGKTLLADLYNQMKI